MANEKSTSVSLQISKGGLTARDSFSLSETLAGTDFVGQPVVVTTSWVAIPLGSLASFDLLYIKNTDATNFIEVAPDAAGVNKFAKIIAGRGLLIPVNPAVTLYWKADTASCVCNLVATEP